MVCFDPQIDDHGPFNSLDMLKNKPGIYLVCLEVWNTVIAIHGKIVETNSSLIMYLMGLFTFQLILLCFYIILYLTVIQVVW